MFVRFIHVFACSSIHSLLLSYCSLLMNKSQFIHSICDGHLGSFDFLDIMNNGAVNICTFLGVYTYVYISVGCIIKE